MLGTAQRERAQHGWALCYSERDRSDRVERDKGQEGALHVADSSGVRRLCCLSKTDPHDAPAASSLSQAQMITGLPLPFVTCLKISSSILKTLTDKLWLTDMTLTEKQ